MLPPRRRAITTGANADKTVSWLSWADKDYVASRRLLLDGLLVQGATLANTAIEKYLKAILAIGNKGIPRVHNPLNIYRDIKPNGTLRLDEAFLALLVKAYGLRYPDDLKAGFNIVLSQALILIALDESVFEINRRFTFRREDGKAVQRLFDTLLDDRDPRLMINNTVVGSVTKVDFLNHPSSVYEMRILPNGVLMEIDYIAKQIENTSFDREGFIQKNEKQFELTQTSIPYSGSS